MSTENNDFGRYTITVKVTSHEYKPAMYYTFEIWLNTFKAKLTPSIPFGDETTSRITIQLNYYAIYQELGNFQVRITGRDPININANTVGENKISEIVLKENQVYYIQLWSESGSLISSYKITKLEPLNTMAIIIIVAAVILVLLLILLFIKLRTKMKVR